MTTCMTGEQHGHMIAWTQDSMTCKSIIGFMHNSGMTQKGYIFILECTKRSE